jgi:UDP-3-O-acyl-N-acetylglucosamine deacetylase
MLMQNAAPEIPISDEAAKMLKVHLEEHGRSLAEQASRIHQGENELRKQIGERLKKRLSSKHMRMAIDGKFTESGGKRADQ